MSEHTGLADKLMFLLLLLPTGIDDPYEEPIAPEIILDARDSSGEMQSATKMAETVLQYLRRHQYLVAPAERKGA